MMTHHGYEVAVAGVSVVDIIGRSIDVQQLPKRGGLQFLDSIMLTTGGNVSNVGIDLQKLGLRTVAITRIGDDTLGRFLQHQYVASGMKINGVLEDTTDQTSATIVCVGEDGERTFLHTRGCMKNFRAGDVLGNIHLIKQSKILAFGYLGLLPEVEKDFPMMFQTIKRQASVEILLDTAGAPNCTQKLMKEFLPYVDYFIPSLEEAIRLTGKKQPEEIIQVFRQAGAPKVVGVKLGKEGCYISTMYEGRYIKSMRVNKVIDTTGAGDAFVAGFLAGILKGYNPFESARIGNAVAADCITAIGASTAVKGFQNYA
ncbi:MAG: carbohydrate kinase family protein [Ignavibacteriales bacterium]|nr:carbohydrate kinase family protein [Ignavibacteriales bacterium]